MEDNESWRVALNVLQPRTWDEFFRIRSTKDPCCITPSNALKAYRALLRCQGLNGAGDKFCVRVRTTGAIPTANKTYATSGSQSRYLEAGNSIIRASIQSACCIQESTGTASAHEARFGLSFARGRPLAPHQDRGTSLTLPTCPLEPTSAG
jgi:hypothetical protein